jgi:hypothetical protein
MPTEDELQVADAWRPLAVAIGSPVVAATVFVIAVRLLQGRGDFALEAWLGSCALCIAGEVGAFASGLRIRRSGWTSRANTIALAAMIVAAALVLVSIGLAAIAYFVVVASGID